MIDNGLSLNHLIDIFVDKSSTNLRQLSQECFKSIRFVISLAVHVMFFKLQHAKERDYFKRSLVGMIWTSKFVILICYFDKSTKWNCVLSDYSGVFWSWVQEDHLKMVLLSIEYFIDTTDSNLVCCLFLPKKSVFRYVLNFKKPIIRPFLLFYQAVLPIFTTVNEFLQQKNVLYTPFTIAFLLYGVAFTFL